jgi:hypothetical protein
MWYLKHPSLKCRYLEIYNRSSSISIFICFCTYINKRYTTLESQFQKSVLQKRQEMRENQIEKQFYWRSDSKGVLSNNGYSKGRLNERRKMILCVTRDETEFQLLISLRSALHLTCFSSSQCLQNLICWDYFIQSLYVRQSYTQASTRPFILFR